MIGHIPYGAYWCPPFARWQGSLAHLNSITFAADVTKKQMAEKSIDPTELNLLAFGQTNPQPGSFYAAPWYAAQIGAEHLPAPFVTQACATGPRLLASMLGEMALGNGETGLIASGDKLSNGATIYYPAPHAPGATGTVENWVMDNFNKDPWAKCAMVDTAENVAKRDGIETAEQHELVAQRHAQYQDSLADDRKFQRRYMPVIDIPDASGRRVVGTLETDEGVTPVDPGKMAKLRPVCEGGSVTFAGQTHPADGNAGMIVTRTAEAAQRFAAKDAPKVEVLAFGHGREEKAYMPAAPIKATRDALDRCDLTIADMDAIKSHNPFAVNDIAFARHFNLDWRGINNYGSSLIWGHPQGPTGIRGMIELIEELAERGGGTGLFQGCAAGDSAMAVVLRVS